jgi:hypothetical protein
MNRRVLGIGGLVVLLGLGGCLGFVTGEPLAFESEPAVLANDTTATTNYSVQAYNETELSRTVRVFGAEREVQLSFHRVVYIGVPAINETEVRARAEENPDAVRDRETLSIEPSIVTLLSVPDATFSGQSVNPLTRLSNEELVRQFSGGSGSAVSEFEVAEERSVTMLGSETDLTVFNTTVENGSQPSRVSVAKIGHEDDVVVYIQVRPQNAIIERDRLDTLLERVEHPAAKPSVETPRQ